VITGKGPCLDELTRLAGEPGFPEVLIHGRLTDHEYDEILAGCEVGLALKPRSGPLANTTFPSKVVEMAGAGLLVLTTDISDVRKVLGTGAVYLDEENGAALAKQLRWVAQQSEEARTVARLGQETIAQKCAPRVAGQAVADFLFEGRP
jgi:glycosyltransferase involved in cell wall biosynthesis